MTIRDDERTDPSADGRRDAHVIRETLAGGGQGPVLRQGQRMTVASSQGFVRGALVTDAVLLLQLKVGDSTAGGGGVLRC